MSMSNSESRKRDEQARAAHNASHDEQTTARIEAVLIAHATWGWVPAEVDDSHLYHCMCGASLTLVTTPEVAHRAHLAATLASTLDEGLAGKVRELADRAAREIADAEQNAAIWAEVNEGAYLMADQARAEAWRTVRDLLGGEPR